MAQPVETRNARTVIRGLGSQPVEATTMPQRGGLGGLGADVATLRATLHDLTLAIQQAQATGQTVAADQLRRQWTAVQLELNRLTTRQNASDQPGGVMRALADFSDFATTTVGQFFGGVAALPAAAGKALPLLAIGAVVLGGALVWSRRGGKRG